MKKIFASIVNSFNVGRKNIVMKKRHWYSIRPEAFNTRKNQFVADIAKKKNIK